MREVTIYSSRHGQSTRRHPKLSVAVDSHNCSRAKVQNGSRMKVSLQQYMCVIVVVLLNGRVAVLVEILILRSISI